MEYFITFLEGLITFISPCLLPMLPIYLTYLAGSDEEHTQSATLKNAAGFITGFSLMFIIMGAFAGSIGMLLSRHQTLINIMCGLIIIVFGLNYLGVFHLPVFHSSKNHEKITKNMNFFSSIAFGIIFSIGWTPCVGAFLGSALMLASQQGSVLKGVLLLLCYSMGLGIPFFLSAILIQQLKSAFTWIKKHYTLINRISGGLLILVGIAMMTGLLNKLLAAFAI